MKYFLILFIFVLIGISPFFKFVYAQDLSSKSDIQKNIGEGGNLINEDTIHVIHSGSADAGVDVTVADPSKLTGDKYQISFHNETYSLGSNNQWVDITTAGKKMAKVKDLTGSSISSTAAYSEKKGDMIIHYLVDVESPNYDYCDGVKLQLPMGVTIDTAYEPISNNTGRLIPYTFDKSINTLFYSVVSPDSLMSSDTTHRTTNGVFAGGEDIKVEVHQTSLPIVTHWNMYDDNFGSVYGYGGKLVDVSGTDTLKTIANQVVIQHQWNITDLITGNIVLENQTIYNGQDIYASQLYFSEYGIDGPGGSSGSANPNVGVGANVIFDGLRVSVNGTFSAPTTYEKVIINSFNGTGISYGGGSYEVRGFGYDMADFTLFGSDGTAANSLPLYGGAGGTTSTNLLQDDYELRWTGIVGDTVINGQHVETTKSGGSIATIFGASNYDLGDHPLNPSPGSENPFTIRIPFQVWNINENEQVNLLLYDRNAGQTQNPGVAADTFETWNTRDRMYVWAVNTKYVSTVIDPTSSIVADSATWNWIFFSSNFHTGDVIDFIYNNPLQIGKDTFTFTAPGPTGIYSNSKNIIKKFALMQNYPNPFNPSTTIQYAIPKESFVTIKVYDILGRRVAKLVNERKPAGNYSINFDASNMSSGIYFYQMKAGNYTQTKKMIVLK